MKHVRTRYDYAMMQSVGRMNIITKMLTGGVVKEGVDKEPELILQ
jgi:hypothetical protein